MTDLRPDRVEASDLLRVVSYPVNLVLLFLVRCWYFTGSFSGQNFSKSIKKIIENVRKIIGRHTSIADFEELLQSHSVTTTVKKHLSDKNTLRNSQDKNKKHNNIPYHAVLGSNS